jgi:hypothetical protein
MMTHFEKVKLLGIPRLLPNQLKFQVISVWKG